MASESVAVRSSDISKDDLVEPAEWTTIMKPSPTIAFFYTLQKLKEEGHTVFDLGIGEMHPDFLVPKILKDGIINAVNNDEQHYHGSKGDTRLLKAISNDYKLWNIHYEPEHISICAGPKDALFKAAMAILIGKSNNENGVVVWSPLYESFDNVPILLTGRSPIVLNPDERFYPKPDELDDVLSKDPSIRLIILNYPNNPTGAVFPDTLLRKLADVIRKYPKVTVLADEVYRFHIFEENQNAPLKYLTIARYLPGQTLVVGGLSKEAAGTGLRIGYVASFNTKIIKAIDSINGNTLSCVNLPTQRGYAAFLEVDTDFSERKAIRDKLATSRSKMLELLKSLEGFKLAKWHPPEGAFYFFPDISAYLGKAIPGSSKYKTPSGKIDTDEDLSMYLLINYKVGAIPGSRFLAPGHLRITFARKVETVEGGIRAMSDGLLSLLN